MSNRSQTELGWAERLKEARGFYDDSQEQMAARLGVPYRTYQGWENRVSPPKAEALNRLVELGFSADWLLRGRPPMRRQTGDMFQAVVEVEHGQPADGVVGVPLYTSTRAAAGGGAVIEGEVVRRVNFDEAMLRRELGVTPRELALVAAEGESMEPTIRAGELLLFDRSEQGRRPRDGIFIVRLEGSMMVKRLQPMPGQTIAVSSENPAFQPFLVRLDEATDFEILGRVVVVFRRL